MIIPIVNESDEIIGHKLREGLDYSKDIFRSASVWVTNSDGDILLAQRKHTKSVDPGKWAEAVGGTVEGYDSYEQTAKREAQEELGIKGMQFLLGPKQFITTPCRYFVQWYTVCVNKPIAWFNVQPEEVEAIVWMPLSQLKHELDTLPQKYIAALPEIIRLIKE